jgi:hypothetical protein
MTGRVTPVYENRISDNNPSTLGTELVMFQQIKEENKKNCTHNNLLMLMIYESGRCNVR